MEVAAWAVVVGGLLVIMGLGGSALRHLPLSTAMLYLPVGLAIGPAGLALVSIDAVSSAKLLEHLTEAVVVVSLFTVGLKLSVALDDPRWRLPLRLAIASMAVTVGLIAAIGVAIGLPLGAAVLLGAILAPTDPVLASDVQVADPQDRDRLRVALTGEGGLNDGTAFPFVMLGLGLLGLHPLGELGWRWLAVDVAWAVGGGLAIGAALGTLVGRLVLHLRRRHRQAVGYDDFLALGLIGLAYGGALLATTYGFLAVFAAGVALRRVERRETHAGRHAADVPMPPGEVVAEQALTNPTPPIDADHVAVHPAHAPAFMAHAMLGSNEQLERIGEVAAVVLVGVLLWTVEWSRVPWWFVPVLFLAVRPVSVAIGLAGSGTPAAQRRLIGWFGIRGIGSLYYLGYAMTHGLDPELARTLVALTLAAVVASIVVHGVSVTPLMARYERLRGTRGAGS
jgi:NhaP-type Na+/H+ or K+/H+ antiporter